MAKKTYSARKLKQLRRQHDELFKAAFGMKEVSKTYIERFLANTLVQKIDLDSLVLDNTTYIDPHLRAFYSDVVWEANYNGETIKIGFLYEHKSYPSEHIHVQLLRYMLQKWEYNIKSKDQLTVIIPIVVYHNIENQRWEQRDFEEYFKGIDADLLQYIPSFKYELMDITKLTDEEILAQRLGLLGITLMAFKHGADTNYIENNFNIIFMDADKFADDDYGVQFLRTIYTYLMRNAQISTEKMITLVEKQATPATKKMFMSTYDLFKKEGRAEGRAEALAEKTQQVIKNLIQEFPNWDDEKVANLASATLDEVQAVREILAKEDSK